VYLDKIARRNRSEVFVVGIFNLALLVIVLFPVMSMIMLVHADHRTAWLSTDNFGAQSSFSTWSIGSGDGVLELSQVDRDQLGVVPIKNSKKDFRCSVGTGSNASEQFSRYLDYLSCESTLKDSAVVDPRTTHLVTLADSKTKSQAHDEVEAKTSLDYTVWYLVLVYVIIVVIPCLICFWNVSKIFDSKWGDTAKTMALRGIPKMSAALMLSAAPLTGLITSFLVAAVPLYLVSRVLQHVSWEGRGFLLIDAWIGLGGALSCGALFTIVLAALTCARRGKIVAEID